MYNILIEWTAFSMEMELSIDNSYGVLRNGSWDGVRGQLQRGVHLFTIILIFTMNLVI